MIFCLYIVSERNKIFMAEKLIIIGARGHGKVIADIALKSNGWDTIVFLDDDESIKETIGFEVIGKPADAIKYSKEADFFVAIGNNSIREKMQEKLEDEGLSIASLTHPKAVIATDVEIGKGTAIMAGVIINSSCKIGKGCIINTASTLDHDNVIEDYVHVSPGVHLAGTVSVGKRSWLGVGSIVSNNLNISDDSQLGAGAVAVKDIVEPGTYVGVPVRKVD